MATGAPVVSDVYVDPACPEFVEGWSMVQTLGEGAFGEVKLLVNRKNGEAVALKMVDLVKHPEAENAVQKEMLIHKILKHQNIIRFFGNRREGMMQYMFLEYAVGGELFDRIEPDVGMPVDQARNYFRSILDAMAYIHSKGITHRDIKPENILLDANDCIKITDFGMATLFKHNDCERLLNRRCGTKLYMAPEVLMDVEYHAEPADVWCCVVVLVAMLSGELPWKEASSECADYVLWKKRDTSYIHNSPWTKINTTVLSLVRKVLVHNAASRLTIPQIMEHTWMVNPEAGNRVNVKRKIKDSLDERESKRMCSELEGGILPFEDERVACSQPEYAMRGPVASTKVTPVVDFDPDTLCFSQPARMDALLLSQDGMPASSQAASSSLQRLVRRMTRLLVSTNLPDTLRHLHELLEKLGYTVSSTQPNVLTVHTTDKRGALLTMKANVLNMGPHILVDIRRSKGCGIDFKRQFVRIKEGLKDIVVKGPVTWSLADAVNMLPS